MKKINIKIITEIAIFASIGFVLDYIQGIYSDLLPFPFGGSIGIAGIVVVIIGLRHGFWASMAVGILMGLLDMMDGFYAYTSTWYKAIAQLSLDYIFAYTAIAFGAFMRAPYLRSDTKQGYIYASLAVLIGYSVKYFGHFLSGILFWPNDEANSQIIYSLTYNGAYTIPCMILTAIVLVLVMFRYPDICPKTGEE